MTTGNIIFGATKPNGSCRSTETEGKLPNTVHGRKPIRTKANETMVETITFVDWGIDSSPWVSEGGCKMDSTTSYRMVVDVP